MQARRKPNAKEAARLMSAAASGNARVLRELASAGVDLDGIIPELGASALMLCAMEGNAEAIRELLGGGVNPNLKGKDGQTALFFSLNNYPECLMLLLDSGADPNAAMKGSGLGGITPLIRAVGFRNGASVQLLLDSGADPNQADKEGRTPLMHAAMESAAEAIITRLISTGAAIDACEPRAGRTALMIAAESGLAD